MDTVKCIVKAANILELFLDNKDILSLGDIAKATGINKATVSRIVYSLVSCGLLKQQKKRGKYSLGVRFLDFSEFINKGPNRGIGGISYLVELSRLINESVYLVMWHGSDVMDDNLMDYYQGSLNVIPSDWVDKPLFDTCVGRIILSTLNDDVFKKYYKNFLSGKYDLNYEQMNAYINTVRRDGVAMEEGIRPGINGVAVSIKNIKEEIVGAIFMIGSAERLTRKAMMKSVPTLKNCAMKISGELGESMPSNRALI
jgi:IclR family transcriptional regulator, KDG regulon repressor